MSTILPEDFDLSSATPATIDELREAFELEDEREIECQ